MAKGDKNDVKDAVNTQTNSVQTGIDSLRTANQGQTQNFQNLYNPAAATNVGNYGDVMGSYKSFLGNQPNSGQLLTNFLGTNKVNPVPQPNATGATSLGPSGASATAVDDSLYAPTGDPNKDAVLALYKKYNRTPGGPGSGLTDTSYWSSDAMKNAGGDSAYVLKRLEDDLQGHGMDADPSKGGGGSTGATDMGALNPAIAGYQKFAETGGFSPDDIQNIRARAVAPIRSIADNARQQIQRQAAIRGTGYSPNTTAALAKTARDSEYAAGDTATNAEAAIAGLKNQGQLAGLGGLSSTGLGINNQNLTNALGLRGQDLSSILGAQSGQLGAMSGMTGLYGATPGLTNTFGNQVLQSGNQGINIGQLQQALMNGNIQGQLGMANVPSTFQNVMGNIGQIGQLGANALTGFAGGVSGGLW